MKKILLIPRIQVQNANALSSPYTIGFPAMSAWLGGVHALERHLRARGYKNIQLKSTAVVCHDICLQTYKKNKYTQLIKLTGNPLKKDGKRSSSVEIARCHLNVSLMIECKNIGIINRDELPDIVYEILMSKMNFAGGDILSVDDPEIFEVSDEIILKRLLRKVMPGYCLVERRDLMTPSMEEGKDAVDALLEHISVNHNSDINDQDTVTWNSTKKEPGWIVPIAIGFLGLTDIGIAENQRDPDTPHRFAESVVTLGEFIMPYRIEDLDNILWHYEIDIENNLYLCQQNKPFKNIEESQDD